MSEQTRPPLELIVKADLNGWPVDVCLSLPAEKVPAALARLGELGYTPRHDAAPSPAPSVKQPRPRATHYSPDGTPLCPVHSVPMRQGQHGYYCGKKAAEGEPAGPKGYCNAIAD